jgi:serine/threonine protein phosphatase 1
MRWIVGDIHGMLVPLEAVLAEVARQDPYALLFFAGDYVNRGPSSRQVIDRLLGLGDTARFIRGNHDDMFELVLTGSCFSDNDAVGKPYLAVQWFLDYGLGRTLDSYGFSAEDVLATRADPEAWVERIRDAVPEAHKAFLTRLPPVIEEDDFFLAHAYWYPADGSPGASIGDRLATNPRAKRDIIWTRFAEREVSGPKTWPRVGYFGHTPVPYYANLLTHPFHPVRGPQAVLLDTAAATDIRGRLTAYCHDTQRFIQANREGRIVND